MSDAPPTFRDRVAATDAGLRALGPRERVIATGRCIDITDTDSMHTSSYWYVVVTDRALRFAPIGSRHRASTIEFDRVDAISERTDGHRYAIVLDHAPIERLGRGPAHRVLMFTWGDAEIVRAYTRTQLLFSRRDTDAAVAIRAELTRRGVPTGPHVAERWFRADPFADGVIRLREPHVDEFLRANIYLVLGRDRDLLIDSGLGLAPLRPALDEIPGRSRSHHVLVAGRDGPAPERPIVAVATHRHFDHVGGLYEFDEVVVHRDDADAVRTGDLFASVSIEDYPPEELAGYPPPERLLHALPSRDFDPSAYAVRPVTPTRVVEEGDVIHLGDRRFTVLHLPGHTPGEIGLWEPETRSLFSGDHVYESGVLLDELPESNIPDYVRSMERLRDLDVDTVYGGHDDPFGRPRLLELIDDYVARRG